MFGVNYMSRTILSPILVPLELDLHIGHALGTRLLIFQALGFSIAQLLCGFWLARVRPYQMVALSIVTTGLSLMGNLFVTSYWQVALCFAAIGFTSGLYFPAAMATMASLVPTKNWGKAIAIHELAPNSSFILLPILAQALMAYTDWRGVCAALGGAMVILGIAFGLLARGGREYAMKPSFAGCKGLLSNRYTWIVTMLVTIGIIGEFSTFSVLPAYFATELGISLEKASHLLSMTRLLCPVAAICGGFLADRFTPISIARIYLLLQGICLALMSSDNITIVLIATCMQASFTGIAFPSIFKIIAIVFPMAEQPLLFSLTLPIAAFLGTGAVPQMLGYCGDTVGFATGFIILGIVNICCLFALRSIPKSFGKSM
ncbi:MAG: MFS transporter [Pseudomonadota bacterium]